MSFDADIEDNDIWDEIEAAEARSPNEPRDTEPTSFDPDEQTDLEEYMEDNAYYYTNYYQENP